MLYVKENLKDSISIKIELTNENIFSICKSCGKEIAVEPDLLCHMLKNGDLESEILKCEDCNSKV